MKDESSALVLAIILVWLIGGVACFLVSILTNALIATMLMIGVTYVLVKLGIRLYKGGSK